MTPLIVESKEPFVCFAEFFKDKKVDEGPKKVRTHKFATQIELLHLPNYSHKNHDLRNFETANIPLLNSDINQLVSENIIDHHEKSAKHKNCHIPVIHFTLDLRILQLNE